MTDKRVELLWLYSDLLDLYGDSRQCIGAGPKAGADGVFPALYEGIAGGSDRF